MRAEFVVYIVKENDQTLDMCRDGSLHLFHGHAAASRG